MSSRQSWFLSTGQCDSAWFGPGLRALATGEGAVIKFKQYSTSPLTDAIWGGVSVIIRDEELVSFLADYGTFKRFIRWLGLRMGNAAVVVEQSETAGTA